MSLIKDIILLIVIYLPGKTGINLRNIVYKKKFKSYGKNIVIEPGVIFKGYKNISIGDNVKIDHNCLIESGDRLLGKIINESGDNIDHQIVIGNNIHICRESQLIGYGGLYIQDNCVLSSGCKLYSLSNRPNDPDDLKKIISLMPYKESVFIIGRILLEKNVWLGLNVVIMPNIKIGKNSFVTSNSIVLNNLIENSYAKGSPANYIKNRFEE